MHSSKSLLENLPNILKRVRAKKMLSGAEAALACGCSRQHYSSYENGHSFPARAITIRCVSAFIGVPFGVLFKAALTRAQSIPSADDVTASPESE